MAGEVKHPVKKAGTKCGLSLVVLLVMGAPVATQNVVCRTAVDLVTVDAVVLGSDGRPVANLQADDFVVEVDGRARPVVSAQFVEQTARAKQAPLLDAGHFTTNEDP